ncbi:MAG: hypothetical protein ABIW33_07025 [Sphingomicrobium sp.]
MKLAWSPSCLMWAGFALVAVSLPVWQTGEADLLAQVLIGGSLPLIYEATAWQDAANMASLRYEVDSEEIWRNAYDLRGAIPRFAILYVLIFGILVAREAKVLPDNGWTWAMIVGLILVWGAMTVRSYRQSVAAFVSAKGIAKRQARRRD